MEITVTVMPTQMVSASVMVGSTTMHIPTAFQVTRHNHYQRHQQRRNHYQQRRNHYQQRCNHYQQRRNHTYSFMKGTLFPLLFLFLKNLKSVSS